MNPWREANRAPDRPPMNAPQAKASSLNLNVGTPISSAASSSSRVASHARPIRDSRSIRSAPSTMKITVSISQ